MATTLRKKNSKIKSNCTEKNELTSTLRNSTFEMLSKKIKNF